VKVFGEAGNGIGVPAANWDVVEAAVIGTSVGVQAAPLGFASGSVQAVVVAYAVGIAGVVLVFSTSKLIAACG